MRIDAKYSHSKGEEYLIVPKPAATTKGGSDV